MLRLLPILLIACTTHVRPDLRPVLEERVASGRQPAIVVGTFEDGATDVIAEGHTRDGGPPVDGDTLFEIGSVTKAFTATLLAMMAASGELGLDDPLSKHLPLEGAATGAITLRQLAMHTSGLPSLPDNWAPKDGENPYLDYDEAKLLSYLRTARPARAPGEAYEYSNLGAGTLGHVLSKRAGMPYERLLRARILDPLGMQDTVVVVPERLRGRLATGHANGAAVSGWDFDVLAGAGAIRSTVNDLLKFVAAFSGGSYAPLAATMLRGLRPANHELTRIGLGWHATERYGQLLVWHNGMTGGYASYLAFAPGARRGVVVLTNATQPSEDLGNLAVDPRLLMPKLPALQRKAEIRLAASVVERYVGKYELGPGAVFDVTRQGDQLYVQLTGQSAFPVYASNETTFFYKVVEAKLVFELEDGKATGLVLHQNGREMPARRLPDLDLP